MGSSSTPGGEGEDVSSTREPQVLLRTLWTGLSRGAPALLGSGHQPRRGQGTVRTPRPALTGGEGGLGHGDAWLNLEVASLESGAVRLGLGRS